MSAFWLDWALRSTVLLTLGLLGCLLMRRQSAAVRHTLLATTLVCAAGAPLLERMLPTIHVNVRTTKPAPAAASAPIAEAPLIDLAGPAALPPMTSTATPDAKAASVPVSAGTLPALLLFGVPLLLLARRAFAMAWLGGAMRRGKRSRRLDGVVMSQAAALGLSREPQGRLLEPEACPTAMTWGHRRPVVAMPLGAAEWSDGRLGSVVLHELAHAKRGDWLIQQVAGVAAALLWFSPPAWLTLRRLRAEAECAADELVLQTGVEPADYAEHLLEAVRTRSALKGRFAIEGATTMNNSHFETRIKSIIGYGGRRFGPARLSAIVVSSILLATSIAVASVQFGSSSKPGPVVSIEVGDASAKQHAQEVAKSRKKVAAALRKLQRLNASGKLDARKRAAVLAVLSSKSARLQSAQSATLSWRMLKLNAPAQSRKLGADEQRALAEAMKGLDSIDMVEVRDAVAKAVKEDGNSEQPTPEQKLQLQRALKELHDVGPARMNQEMQAAMKQLVEARRQLAASAVERAVALREAQVGLKEAQVEWNAQRQKQVEEIHGQMDAAREQLMRAGHMQEAQLRAVAEAMQTAQSASLSALEAAIQALKNANLPQDTLQQVLKQLAEAERRIKEASEKGRG